MRTSTRAAAGVLTLALALTACGGDDDTANPDQDASPSAAPADPAAGDDWVAAAVAACVEVNETLEEIEPESDPFAPDATDEDRQANAEWAGAFADELRGFVATVEGLDVPADAQAAVDEMNAALEQAADGLDEAAEAIRANDPDAEQKAGAAFGALGTAEAKAVEAGIGPLESCGEEAVEPDPDANQVAVTAIDYDFELPESIAAGSTAFVMTNEGEEPHFMAIVKLKEAGTLDDALEAEASGGDPEEFVEEEVGDSNTAPPGGTAVVNADLSAGAYAMLCFVSSPDGTPHVAKGMAVEFEVA